jgi:hypothetical protein
MIVIAGLGLAALALPTVLAGCKLGASISALTQKAIDFERYDESETQEWAIPYSDQRIVLENVLGKILVQGRDEPGYVAVRPTLDVIATKKVRGLSLEDVKVLIEQNAQEIRIRVEAPPQMGRRLEGFPPRLKDEIGWVEFTLAVPPGATLAIDQDVGDVRLTSLRGQGRLSATLAVGELLVEDSAFASLTLKSDAGNVIVRDTTAAELNVGTSAGGISLEGSTFQTARLASDTGGIAASRVQGGTLTLSTDVGGIALEDANVERLKATADVGGITLTLTQPPPGPFYGSLSTDVGSITVKLPRTVPFSIDARTEFGRISLRGAKGLDVRKESGWPGEALQLTLGEGLSRLKLRTDMGSIEIILQEPSVARRDLP